jgi:zinc D-Ala-D-Ala carboxypeptidase
MHLSKNFTIDELCKSQLAIDCGIENKPDSDEVVNNLKLLCEKVLQPVRDHYGKPVRINSGYRSEQVNMLARGSKTSDHILGCAADIEINGVPNAELAQWIADNLDYTQVILEFYTPGIPDSGWVHVSYNPANLKKQNLTAAKVDGKTKYMDGFVA